MSRKEDLMKAAIEVFSEKGYTKAAVSDIVQKAGVAQGTFYLYFKNKKEIFLQLVDELLQKIYQGIKSTQLIEAETEEDVFHQIKELYRIILTIYSENKSLAKIFLREAAVVDEDFEKKFEEFYQLCVAYNTTLLDKGKEKGILREYDVNILTCAIIGMIEAVAYNFLIKDGTLDIEFISDNMARFECYGLTK